MTHKATKLSRLSVFAMVLFMTAVFAWPSSAVFAGQLGTEIQTKNGSLQGAEDEYQTWSWKGIPFAQPPIGELRWKAPRAVEDWGTLDATEFGSMCPQYDAFGGFGGSEDCLYLNIWRPTTQQRNLPVYVWIHGGGNSIGSANSPGYIGTRLASNGNMVVVTIQYRLGPFGWFIHPSLQDGDPLDNSGNYGTLDIIQALKWIRANIAAFGGNPKNVTIAGESAGGWNVCSLIISPAAKGLFQRAVSESGGFSVTSVEAGIASANAAIDKMVANDGLSDRPADLEGYLRGKSAQGIFAAYGPWVGGMLDLAQFACMFTDGAVIHADGQAALNNRKHYNQVPTILGTNKEEMKLFMMSAFGTMPDADYQAMTLAASMDWQRTGVNEPATAMSANKGQPDVYAYQFNYGAYNETGYNAWPYPYNVMLGAHHGIEIPFIFGIWSSLFFGDVLFRDDNLLGREALNADIVSYWSSFARTGKPKDPGGVLWKPWSNKKCGAKRILFDANATESIIQMSNE